MRGLHIALTFLTRIPLPSPSDVSSEEFTGSQHYYPLVGLLLGGILWLAADLLQLGYSPLVCGALILLLELILTGGIHLDGFMDSMDALLSARTPERMLEIMKDSHVGAFGTLSVIVLFLLKFTLLADLLAIDTAYPSLVLLFMPFLARWIFLIGVFFYPYARPQGLGKGLHETSRQTKKLFAGQGLLLLLLTFFSLHLAGVLAFLAATLFVFFFTRMASRMLDGLTGDLYGASIEFAEIIFLLSAYPLIHAY